MEDESGLLSSQRGTKRSLKDIMMEEEEQEDPDLDFVECCTKRLYKEPEGLLNKERQHSGNSEADPELYGAESSSFLPDYPQDRWVIRGGQENIQDRLLHSCCPAEVSIDQKSQSSTLEYWVYLDNQHNMADCPVTRFIAPPATSVTQRPCLFTPVPGTVTALKMSSVGNSAVSSPMKDTCSPANSMCSPPGSAWDTLRSTSRSPSCSDQCPVSAAAHLHLLGESLFLIGHHLQETNKIVSMSSSLSLLLDSLLCALAPLLCLTAEIPELSSCTQQTLASTLENIAYVMPGM
ncbi:uncharacterized protein hmgxb4b isoform X2 [Sparus aurata]|nr:uncharacterized protein LOC115588467 isoform X2 [Sparus aurata]XP_030284969.1 uncharacterized protein LOC115588467 isoform X2 [Sparus aurata]